MAHSQKNVKGATYLKYKVKFLVNTAQVVLNIFYFLRALVVVSLKACRIRMHDIIGIRR